MALKVSSKPRVIDLFCGAGIFGSAFGDRGFRIVGSFDRDAPALETLRLNRRSEMPMRTDLSTSRPIGTCEVLIAGPPCQGFSSLGPRIATDFRNQLSLIVPKWALETKAQVVVIENVPQFLRSESFERVKRQMERIGFACSQRVVNARHFGVAQNRNRCVIFFFKREEPRLYDSLAHKSSVGEAFVDLPRYPYPATQHFSQPLSEIARRRIEAVPYGGDIRDIDKVAPELVPPSWRRVRDKIIDIWGRLRWEDVSNTIRTGLLHPSRGRFLHPVDHRPISFREAARLQSIPDDYVFVGAPEQIARVVGNAVPYRLASAIAEAVARVL